MDDFLNVRLASHGLDRFRFSRPEEVVEHYGCLQAQDIFQSAWSVGSRIEGGTWASVRDACSRGAIVRTWPMR